jgi:FixJ family two-component response regulator
MTNQKCIFLVDDDPSSRTGLARLLRKAGHEVRDFSSANDFLDKLEPEISGCLILDARMPGMSNNEVVAELNKRCLKIPIIVVTGDDDPETMEKAKMMKAAGFFRKPVDGPALLDAIKWVLQMGSLEKPLDGMK